MSREHRVLWLRSIFTPWRQAHGGRQPRGRSGPWAWLRAGAAGRDVKDVDARWGRLCDGCPSYEVDGALLNLRVGIDLAKTLIPVPYGQLPIPTIRFLRSKSGGFHSVLIDFTGACISKYEGSHTAHMMFA